EKGHAKVGGGRVPAQVHIRPVEEYVIDELPKRIERAVGQ
ncbi:HK97 gp10 family phage protein, partial [Bacillus cereus group sp. N3]|nr:HK97 gp10 family phage protein [Bacillus cereus group sp. N3]